MKPKLISFKICPFVQRAVIAMQTKGVEFDIEYIDLAEPPAWFLEISPLKKVPLLLVDNQVIFESAVINEYIDEAYPNSLHPADLVEKAHNRSWIEFGNSCMWNAFHLSVKADKEEFFTAREALWNSLDQLEKVVVGPLFNDDQLSLVDVSYAPMFQRLQFLHNIFPEIFDEVRHPKVNAWKDHLLALDVVQTSTVPDIESLYSQLIFKRQGYIAQFLDASLYEFVETSSEGTY